MIDLLNFLQRLRQPPAASINTNGNAGQIKRLLHSSQVKNMPTAANNKYAAANKRI